MNESLLWRKYGITLHEFSLLLEGQDRRCFACVKPFSTSRPACVDHDHMTGQVRGLLCTPCNYAIGERHDKQAWFRRVAEYLGSPPALQFIGLRHVPGSPGAAGESFK